MLALGYWALAPGATDSIPATPDIPSKLGEYDNKSVKVSVGSLSGWDYQKQKTITGTTAGAQTNYQMTLTVYKASGTDTPGVVYLGGNVKDDFSDLRFTRSDGVTLLDYWIESYTSGVSAVVWVELDSIPASPGTVNIDIYYGNPAASGVGIGEATFIGFGGLSSFTGSDPNSKISVVSDARVDISSGVAGSAAYLYKPIVSTGDFMLEFEANITSVNNAGNFPFCIGLSTSGTRRVMDATGFGIYAESHINNPSLTGGWVVEQNNNGARTYPDNDVIGTALNTTYYISLQRLGKEITFTVYSNADRTTIVGQRTFNGQSSPVTFLQAITGWKNTEAAYATAVVQNYRVRKITSPEPAWGT